MLHGWGFQSEIRFGLDGQVGQCLGVVYGRCMVLLGKLGHIWVLVLGWCTVIVGWGSKLCRQLHCWPLERSETSEYIKE